MKFRVYDKQEKKYVDNNNVVLKSDGQLYRVIVRGVIEFLELDPDRYVVEFSTGLKDKNGAEIFEGDVLGGCNGSINGYGITEKWKVHWNKRKVQFQMPLWVYDENCEYTRDDSTHWFEIIGNINGEADGKK
jgi:uncharacterized phage protein (TIGR01671 family)